MLFDERGTPFEDDDLEHYVAPRARTYEEWARIESDSDSELDDEWKLPKSMLRWLPLRDAAIKGKLRNVQKLLSWGVNVNVQERGTNGTALMYACKSGRPKCAQALIDANASLDKVDYNHISALGHACDKGHLECVSTLIKAGATVNQAGMYSGETPLMYACSSGHHECTRALIDAQADLELVNRHGKNALMVACRSPPPSANPSVHEDKARCALALLEAMPTIREVDFHDWVASLELACRRLHILELPLATKHVVEYAPALAKAIALKVDAQGTIVTFARNRLST